MFTKTELLEQYKTLSLKPLEYLRVDWFSRSYHPDHMSTECALQVCRASLADFDNVVQFYCTCMVEPEAGYFAFSEWGKNWQGWVALEIEKALCLPICKASFFNQMKLSFGGMVDLIQLPSMEHFSGALHMSDEWNDQTLLAQFDRDLFFVHWHTTA